MLLGGIWMPRLVTLTIQLVKLYRIRIAFIASSLKNKGDIYASVVKLGVDAGQELIEAKENLEHGEFEAMVESDLPFSSSNDGADLMIAGSDPVLFKSCNVEQDLPRHSISATTFKQETMKQQRANIQLMRLKIESPKGEVIQDHHYQRLRTAIGYASSPSES